MMRLNAWAAAAATLEAACRIEPARRVPAAAVTSASADRRRTSRRVIASRAAGCPRSRAEGPPGSAVVRPGGPARSASRPPYTAAASAIGSAGEVTTVVRGMPSRPPWMNGRKTKVRNPQVTAAAIRACSGRGRRVVRPIRAKSTPPSPNPITLVTMAMTNPSGLARC